jgi:hypothetical protein
MNIKQIMPAAEGWRAELYTVEDGELVEYIVEPVIGWALVEDEETTYIDAAILLDAEMGEVELLGNVAANVGNMRAGDILRPGEIEEPERARARVLARARARAIARGEEI